MTSRKTYEHYINILTYVLFLDQFQVKCERFREIESEVVNLLEFLDSHTARHLFRSSQICPGLNANEMHLPYVKHHKVSSLINTPNSVKYEVTWKCQIAHSNIKYFLNNTCVIPWTQVNRVTLNSFLRRFNLFTSISKQETMTNLCFMCYKVTDYDWAACDNTPKLAANHEDL